MDKPVLNFSLGDVRELLGIQETVEDDPAYLTVSEWADLLDRDITTVRAKLQAAVKDGSFDVRTVVRHDEMGRPYYPQAYKMLAKEEET
jgi:hypothetical protein